MIRTDKPIFYASISDRLPKPFCRINVMQTPAGYTLDYHLHEFYHVNHITGGSVYVMIAVTRRVWRQGRPLFCRLVPLTGSPRRTVIRKSGWTYRRRTTTAACSGRLSV